MTALSNSKISKAAKQWLKAQKDNSNVSLFSFPDTGITVAIKREFPTANTVTIAVSAMSKDEKRFKVKVGEYYAMQRMFYGKTITSAYPNKGNDSYEFSYLAENVADALTSI